MMKIIRTDAKNSDFIRLISELDAYLKVLSTIKQDLGEFRNLYAVFGAGGDRDKTKRSKMAEIAENFAEHCFISFFHLSPLVVYFCFCLLPTIRIVCEIRAQPF